MLVRSMTTYYKSLATDYVTNTSLQDSSKQESYRIELERDIKIQQFRGLLWYLIQILLASFLFLS